VPSSNPVRNIPLLPTEWYLQDDVVTLARELLGKLVLTTLEGTPTAAFITETEAYRGPEDRASHAWGGRRTARTEVMYQPGGVAYVYLCYGIHHLLNVVTGPADIPHAVLIRAIHPFHGMEHMLARRNLSKTRRYWLTGPGCAARALGIRTHHSGLPLSSELSPLQIRDAGIPISQEDILASPRVGVDYAGEDALLPWRFRIGNAHFPVAT
jgi:DNA-3-methyladenine glycosylase